MKDKENVILITKAINNLVGYVYIYPDTKYLFITQFEDGIECGYYDEDDKPITIFEKGDTHQFQTRNKEGFTSEGLLNLVDDLGIEYFTTYLLQQYHLMIK